MQFNDSKPTFQTLSVLIAAYRRPNNVRVLLESCKEAGLSSIFLSLDGPRNKSVQAISDYNKVMEVVEVFESQVNFKIRKQYFESNHGCAYSIIRGIDWAFQSTENLIVLEDDCMPSPNFFTFILNNLKYLESNNDLWLICGTQFAPEEVAGNTAIYSRHALTWGWATNRYKWCEMKKIFFHSTYKPIMHELLSMTPSKSFWNAGARRALNGFTDVWDTILVSELLNQKKFSLLPPTNLVSNVGNDSVSTHTQIDSPWTRFTTKLLPKEFLDSPKVVPDVDTWLAKCFFKIGFRHIFSTKYTLLKDLMLARKRKKFSESLSERLKR